MTTSMVPKELGLGVALRLAGQEWDAACCGTRDLALNCYLAGGPLGQGWVEVECPKCQAVLARVGATRFSARCMSELNQYDPRVFDVVAPLKIANLTQHQPTPEQRAFGVTARNDGVAALLTFENLPNVYTLKLHAELVANHAKNILHGHRHKLALVAGAPFFVPVLEHKLRRRGILPVYAFSVRRMKEGPDGGRTYYFEHAGWVADPRTGLERLAWAALMKHQHKEDR